MTDPARRHRRTVVCGTALVAVALVASACGSTGSTGKSHGTVTISVVQAFTGANALEGPEQMAGCLAAVKVINAAGGVLGNTVACGTTDDLGDPADAVTAVNNMLASTNNLVAVIGPAETAPAVAPIISGFHIPMFSDTGSPLFDKNTNKYFFRIDPSDSLAGIAMAAWGAKQGNGPAVAVFTNDAGAQTTVPALLSEYQHLTGTAVKNITLVPDQTSYRTEVQTLLSAHPQVVFTEMDPQTAGTFWGEVQQLKTGAFPNVLVTTSGTKSAYIQAVTGAIGASTFATNFVAVSPLSATGPGYDAFKTSLSSLGSAIKDPSQYLTDSYTIADYDAVMLAALAMVKAKSTTPSSWVPDVLPLAASASGGTTVSTYADGVTAINAGKTVSYLGAYGPFAFNQYQNSSAPFAILQWDASTQADKQIGELTPQDLSGLSLP